MKLPTYREHLIAVHRLHLDALEADGDGPLDTVAYRNKINRARWQARWSAYPPEPGPTGKPDSKTGEGG